MKDTCCDFCGREKNEDELVPFGKAKICISCQEEQKSPSQRGKISKGGMFHNSQLSK